MSVMIRRLLTLSTLALLFALPGAATAKGPPVRVATFVLPPFVMKQNGALTGFSIDLWEAIAKKLDVDTQYTVKPDVNGVFDTLRARQADIAVSGLFYTVERDRDFDFTYPIMEAGLRVMVRDVGERATANPLTSLLTLLFSRSSVIWLGVAMLLIVAAAHVLWLLERNRDGTLTGGRYFPGIFKAMYWSASTLLTQAEEAPRLWLARILTVLWMFVGIVFVAFYTAQLTTTLTVQHIRGEIAGPDDLPGKRVGTLKSGSPVAWLNDHRAIVVEYAQTEQLNEALLGGDVDAVVLGSAGLAYYAAHDGRGRVKLVGPEFSRNDVGFVLPQDGSLRRRVDSALLSLREDGTYRRIYERWFGEQE